MTAYAGLLRAVNLPSHNKVAATDLRAMLGRLGFANVRSLLQSGNLVFEARPRSTAGLERTLERAAANDLRLETDVFVRSASEWDDVVAANPFRAEAKRDPGHLLVVVLKDAPGAPAVTALRKAIRGRERVEAEGRHAYVVYPDGVGRSKLTARLIERHLGTRGTARNWNTVLKLQAMLRG